MLLIGENVGDILDSMSRCKQFMGIGSPISYGGRDTLLYILYLSHVYFKLEYYRGKL